MTSGNKGCTWPARSNDPFLAITSGASGLDNGVVSFAVAPNPLPLFTSEIGHGLARSGTLTVAGTRVAVSQDAARARTAADDPVFKALVCQEVGEGCGSGHLLGSTIFNACADGSGPQFIESIAVATPDGSPMTAGKAVRIVVKSQRLGGRIFIAADALHPVWVEVPITFLSITFHEADTILAGPGLQAVRATYGSSWGPGPCATGPGFENDDLVFRVQ